jgi:hypothetical protein
MQKIIKENKGKNSKHEKISSNFRFKRFLFFSKALGMAYFINNPNYLP